MRAPFLIATLAALAACTPPVHMSQTMVPGAIAAAADGAPSRTSAVAAASAIIVMTIDEPLTAAAAESAGITGQAAASWSTAARLRFQTVTECPASTSLTAMAAPIRPRPSTVTSATAWIHEDLAPRRSTDERLEPQLDDVVEANGVSGQDIGE